MRQFFVTNKAKVTLVLPGSARIRLPVGRESGPFLQRQFDLTATEEHPLYEVRELCREPEVVEVPTQTADLVELPAGPDVVVPVESAQDSPKVVEDADPVNHTPQIPTPQPPKPKRGPGRPKKIEHAEVTNG